MRVLVIGDVHLIAAGTVPRFPDPGDNVILDDPYGAVSGVGTNVAHALRGLEVEVDVANAVGQDTFGDAILENLRHAGIGVEHVQRLPEPTSVFLIFVDAERERTMIGYRGACAHFSLDPVLRAPLPYAWIHMSGYTMLNTGMPDAFRRLADGARAQGIPCSLDLEGLAQARRRLDLSGLTVFCNQYEYATYFGTETIPSSAGAERLVVKRGAEGCVLVDGDGARHIPGFSAGVVDLTGAGDAFNAGYIVGCLRGLSVEEACRWGNAAGAIKVGQRGPRVHLSTGAIDEMAGDSNVRA